MPSSLTIEENAPAGVLTIRQGIAGATLKVDQDGWTSISTGTVEDHSVLVIRDKDTQVLSIGYSTPGPAGPAGPPGTGVPGQPRFSGVGPPPAFIAGMQQGDLYLDTSTGMVYRND